MIGGRAFNQDGGSSKDETAMPKKLTPRNKRANPDACNGEEKTAKRPKTKSERTPSKKRPASPKVKSDAKVEEGDIKVKEEWSAASEQLWREQSQVA